MNTSSPDVSPKESAKPEQVKPIKAADLTQLQSLFSTHRAAMAPEVQDIVERTFGTINALSVQSEVRAKKNLQLFREALGIIPKSEKTGSADLKSQIDKVELEEKKAIEAANVAMTPAELERHNATIKRYREARTQMNAIKKDLKKQKKPKQNGVQLELGLAFPEEMLFCDPIGIRPDQAETKEKRVNREPEFENPKGLHSSYDYPSRVDLSVNVKKITYKVETVTDPRTGKSVRASMLDEGPEGSSYTWGSIANLIKMHVGFAIPMNRISLMIGQVEFSVSQICRILQQMAEMLLPIYLVLPDQLADVKVLHGDDTKTKVLEAEEISKSDKLSEAVEEALGWKSALSANGKPKRALNVSLVVGRTEEDPRSTIRFFRTHVGSLGNILTKILELRSPKAGPVFIQGDLSTTNLPSKDILAKLEVIQAGCGAHARRPMWKLRDSDAGLCYYVLRGFLLLARLEAKIDATGRTRENVLKIRGKHGKKIWEAIRNRCIAAVTGKSPTPTTYHPGVEPTQWPPDHELYRASNYIINHYDALTLYLTNPALSYTNNAQERGLRIEKIMLDGSKFRQNRHGRVMLDILRTFTTTCNAAKLDVAIYLKFVGMHTDELATTPEKLTPYAVALRLEAERLLTKK